MLWYGTIPYPQAGAHHNSPLALVDYSHFLFRNPNGFAILRRRYS